MDTADEVITVLAETPAEDRAQALEHVPTKLLRDVADLMYACDYPDVATRRQLVKGILEAAS